jgi:hypothetical protein
VRTFWSLALIGSLTLCPVLCSTAAVGGCGGCHHVQHGAAPGDHSAPADEPGAGDDCICDGAIALPEVRAEGGGTLILPLDLMAWVPIAPEPCRLGFAPLDRGVGLPLPPDDALTLRAWLQNFRC